MEKSVDNTKNENDLTSVLERMDGFNSLVAELVNRVDSLEASAEERFMISLQELKTAVDDVQSTPDKESIIEALKEYEVRMGNNLQECIDRCNTVEGRILPELNLINAKFDVLEKTLAELMVRQGLS